MTGGGHIPRKPRESSFSSMLQIVAFGFRGYGIKNMLLFFSRKEIRVEERSASHLRFADNAASDFLMGTPTSCDYGKIGFTIFEPEVNLTS